MLPKLRDKDGVCGMRLIDADALPYDEFLNGTRIVMQSDIDNAITVDAVAVVRCKDCKHYDYHHPSHEQCIMWKHAHIKPSVDYCSYGERREG